MSDTLTIDVPPGHHVVWPLAAGERRPLSPFVERLHEVSGLPRVDGQGRPWRDPENTRIDDVVYLIEHSKKYRRRFRAIGSWQAMFAYAGDERDPAVWTRIVRDRGINEGPEQFLNRHYALSRKAADIMDAVSRRGLGATRPL